MQKLFKASDRGADRLDWLDTRYSFSFAGWHDPSRMGFRSLRVLNEDRIEPGMGAIIWAHAVHNVPFVALVVMARLSTLPKSQMEAARDLGADPIIAFLRITLPYLIPAILGASIFCLLLSFDDFVRSFFLGGYEPTLPVLIFAKLRSGMSPEINAIATVALILTAAIGIWAERFTRRMNKDPQV